MKLVSTSFVLMASVAVLLLTSCASLVSATSGFVQPLTVAQLEAIYSRKTHDDGTNSPFWVVRFSVPWEDETPAVKAFNEAAADLPTEGVQFGQFNVDSVDAIAMADAMGIVSFPTVRAIGSRYGRPGVTKGQHLTGRPMMISQDFKGDETNAAQLKEYAIQSLPNNYVNRVTSAIVPTVHKVENNIDIGTALKTSPMHNALAVVFFGRLTEVPYLQLAALHGQAALYQGRVVVALSTTSAVARELKSSLPSEGKGLNAAVVKLTSDGKTEVVTNAEDISTPEQLAKLLQTHAVDYQSYIADGDDKLAAWEKDASTYITDSPLRKLETSTQFEREVIGSKNSIAIIFLLRESDDQFNRQWKTAVEVATFAREIQTVNIISNEKATPTVRTDVFWVDAEVHPNFAKGLGATGVPSIAFLLPLQNDMTGVKWFPGKEFPSGEAVKVNRYIMSQNLMDTKEVRPMVRESVSFSENPKTKLGPNNNQYLNIDRVDYTEDVPAPQLVQDVLAALQEQKAEGGKPKKLSSKAAKKKKEKEEKRKAEIKAELERKAKEREAAIKAKQEADAAARKAQAEAAAARREAKKNEPKKPKAKKPKKQPPRKRKVKPPKDLQEELKAWELESRLMAEKFIQKDKDGNYNMIHSLSAPPKQ